MIHFNQIHNSQVKSLPQSLIFPFTCSLKVATLQHCELFTSMSATLLKILSQS